jgi:hypothetical protein
MHWDVILTSVLTSGLVVVALNWLRDAYENKRRQNSEASYLAIQLVVILEKYAAECIVRAWSIDEIISAGQWDNIKCELPKLTTYPQDTSLWKSLYILAASPAERALLLPNKIASSEDISDFEATFEGNKAAIADDVVVTGMEALTLAKELRKKFSMDDASIKHAKTLERKYLEIQTRQAEWEARRKIITPAQPAT